MSEEITKTVFQGSTIIINKFTDFLLSKNAIVIRWRAGRPGFNSRLEKRYSLRHRHQTGPRAHPASYPKDTGLTFLRDKATGAWSWPLTSI